MKRPVRDIYKEIISYAKKLPAVKQMEALDFVKWLWGGPGAETEFTPQEIEKIESLSKKKGSRKFRKWEDAKKYLQDLM